MLICVLTILFLMFPLPLNRARAESTAVTEGNRTYTHYCAPCHGDKGNGKGFNAQNLDPRPANHTDGEFMNKRTNKELHDAVSGGGRAVGRSTLMPPWGYTLNNSQIMSLILYLRKLCSCHGP